MTKLEEAARAILHSWDHDLNFNWQQMAALRAALAEHAAERSETDRAEVIGRHEGKTNHRDWWSGGAWLYPGDEVVIRSKREAEPAADREGLTEEQIFAALPSGIMDCLMDPWDCGTGDRFESIRRDIVRIARAIESEVRK